MGIRRKNLARARGRPLLAYTVDAALASKQLTRTVVSTDDQEIAGIAQALGAEVPFLRPSELAAGGQTCLVPLPYGRKD